MRFELYKTDNVRIKKSGIIGTLVDEVYRKDRKKYLYILEEKDRNEDGDYPLHDVWEDEIEYV